ncbi:carbohydrate-binding protein, partial [Microbulbifer mangrovi]|uniref:carbohydrate-binding protein n=1 Tax=Microbulbifer mangrovi TaxID=927787 RepID=UPI00117C5734
MKLPYPRRPLVLAQSVLAAGIALSTAATAADYRIEAENFTTVGGTYADGQPQKISVYNVNGVTAINYVNRGDYAEYTLQVAEAGTYNLQYLIGTSMTSGAEIDFQIGSGSSWTSLVKKAVPAGHWDNFQSLDAGNISLPAGAVNLRVVGSGSNDWQWNLDALELTQVSTGGGSSSGGSSSSGSGGGGTGFTVQAEDFTQVGGTYADGQPQKISVYSVNGATAINYVNKG